MERGVKVGCIATNGEGIWSGDMIKHGQTFVREFSAQSKSFVSLFLRDGKTQALQVNGSTE